MIKLAIFDLDGTLLNTISDLGEATNHALATCGFPIHPIESYPQFVGNGVNKLIKRALPQEKRDQETILLLRGHFIDYYNQHMAVRTTPYTGIPQLLSELHSKGIALAVASNKYDSATKELVTHYFPSTLFACVLGQRDGYPPKPDPTIVNDLLRTVKIAPDEAVYIGDSGVDMETAKNSNIYSIGVTWGFRPQCELSESGACAIANNSTEVLETILSLNNKG